MRPGSESAAQGFEEQVTNQRCYQGDDEIGCGGYILECPGETLRTPHSRTFELAHQKVGIEEEDDKTDLRHRSQGFSLHLRTLSWMGSDDKAIRHLARQETK
jgi:hypothetical protein